MNIVTKKGLFILHEGISSTIFNSQVLEHSKGLKKSGIEFDILSFDTLAKTWELSKNNLGKAKITHPDVNIKLIKAMNIYYPFSLFVNFILLVSFFKKNKKNYSFIHARTDYTTFLCILTKPFHNLPVYWDCRGDNVSELKDSLSRKNLFVRLIGNFYLVNFERIIIFLNCKLCDGAIFVSQALFELFKNMLVTKNYEIIPCPVSEKLFFFDSRLRLTMRNKFKFDDKNIVYLYSGSMVAYQSLQVQYLLYKRLLQNPENIIIIVTSDPEIAVDYFKNLNSNNLIILSANFEEMNHYYNLSDFAFLIREKKQLNFVASPTKFGEYCLTGLPVIMNDTVDQSLQYSKELGNYVNWDVSRFNKFGLDKRDEISSKAKFYFSRIELNKQYINLYQILI